MERLWVHLHIPPFSEALIAGSPRNWVMDWH